MRALLTIALLLAMCGPACAWNGSWQSLDWANDLSGYALRVDRLGVGEAAPAGSGDLQVLDEITADDLHVDNLTNEAGSGAPSFTYGLALAASQSITFASDGTCVIGASGADASTVWTHTLDSGSGTVDVAAALTADSLSLDANADVTISGTGAFKGSYIEAADGTTAITLSNTTALATFAGAIDAPDAELASLSSRNGTQVATFTDSTAAVRLDGALTVAGAATSLSNVAATLDVGTASSTTGSKLSLYDGGTDKPGAVALYQGGGTPVWIWPTSANALRYGTSYPTTPDSDGSAFGGVDMAADFDLTAVGGSTGDPDFSWAGYGKGATLELTAGLLMASGQTATVETLVAVDADGVTVKGYAGDADLLQVADASTERWAITTSASADSVVETYTDKDGSDTLTYDAGVFTFSDNLDAAGPVSGDSFTADANGDVAVSGTGAFKGGYIEASDGTTAITITDSTAAVAFAGSVTLGDNTADVVTVNADTVSLTDGSTLTAETIKAADSTGLIARANGGGTLLDVQDTGSNSRYKVTTDASTNVVETYTDSTGSGTLTYDTAGASPSAAFTFSGGLAVNRSWTSGTLVGINLLGTNTADSNDYYLYCSSVHNWRGDGLINCNAINTVAAAQVGTSLAVGSYVGTDNSGTGSEAYIRFSGTTNSTANNDRARIQMCDDDDGTIGGTTDNAGLALVFTPTPANVAASVVGMWVTSQIACFTQPGITLQENDSVPFSGGTTKEGTFWFTDDTPPTTQNTYMGRADTAEADKLYVFKNGKWRTVTLAD